MAGAEIIASAIGVLFLVVAGYLLVGSILTSGEITATAQKDYTLAKESQLGTAIDIPHLSPAAPQFICQVDSWTWLFWTWTWQKCTLTFYFTNTGSEMIGDFNHIDVFVNTSENIVRGPALWPSDVLTPAGYVKQLKFVPSGGNEPSGTWSYIELSPNFIHPDMLDPDEKMKVQINNYRFWTSSPAHYSITVATPNGIIDTYYI